jgi:hypothetical protein
MAPVTGTAFTKGWLTNEQKLTAVSVKTTIMPTSFFLLSFKL